VQFLKRNNEQYKSQLEEFLAPQADKK